MTRKYRFIIEFVERKGSWRFSSSSFTYKSEDAARSAAKGRYKVAKRYRGEEHIVRTEFKDIDNSQGFLPGM